MKQYKVVVAGTGYRTDDHIEAYKHIKNAKVTAVSSNDEERARKQAAKHGIKPYVGLADMLKAEKPDLVHITTKPIDRAKMLKIVSDAGVPACTVEKPLATNVPEWRELCKLAKTSKTRIAVCHQVRWHANLVRCQEALRSGKLGKVLFVEATAGMNIMGQGTHTLNYSFSLNGDSPVVRVFGNASGYTNEDVTHPAPDMSEAYLTYANGARGLWTSGPVSPRCGDPDTVWQHVRVAAYAEKGRTLYEEFGKWEIVGPDGEQRGNCGTIDEWRQANIMAQARFHQNMLEWIEDDRKAAGTNLKQSVHECAVILALYQSTLEHRPVEMDGFDPPDDLFERLKTKLEKKGK